MASWEGIRPMMLPCWPGVGDADRREKMPPPGLAGGVCRAARRGLGAGDGDRAARGLEPCRLWRASEMMSIVPSSQERLRRCVVVPLALEVPLALGALMAAESEEEQQE